MSPEIFMKLPLSCKNIFVCPFDQGQTKLFPSLLGFSNYERVKEFSILPRLFTIEDGELTPTLKVIRKVVLDNFSDSVEKNYSGSPKEVSEPEPVAV